MNTSAAKYTWLFLLLLAVVLTGCSAPKVKVNLSSTATLNLNNNDEALPVVVRIYQLSDNQAFENASFEDLWKSDISVLGNTLLRKEIVVLDPASQQKIEVERHDLARYVGIMAAFHNQPDNSWRVIKRADKSFLWIDLSTRINALLKDNSVELID